MQSEENPGVDDTREASSSHTGRGALDVNDSKQT